MYFGAKLYYKQPYRRAEEMDFDTNTDEFGDDTYVCMHINTIDEAYWDHLEKMNFLQKTRL